MVTSTNNIITNALLLPLSLFSLSLSLALPLSRVPSLHSGGGRADWRMGVVPKRWRRNRRLALLLSSKTLTFYRFHTVAYLQQIWWFEVDGEIEFCFPAGRYTLFFRIYLGRPSKRLGRRVCNREHIHGWDIKPVRFQLSTSRQHSQRQCYLGEPGTWIHYEVGEFVVENSHTPTKVKFSMMQIDCTHTKGGLCVDSVLIYPNGVRPEKVFIDGR